MLSPPIERHLGEEFVRGEIDIAGDLEAATELEDEMRERLASARSVARMLRYVSSLPRGERPPLVDRRSSALTRLGRRHSPERDSRAIRSHYDVGNDFYSLWLDRLMVYSCGYFETGGESIDTAQEAKLDLICRKLRLRAGDRLLDIGCGWGALIQYAAERYGVSALGVTLSPSQARLASQRISEAKLAGRCVVRVMDYRNIEPSKPFDKIVSVGMFEHVGPDQLPVYFRKVNDLLAPGGLFLNHGIVEHPNGSPRSPAVHGFRAAVGHLLWGDGQFMDRYVFPDGELSTMRDVVGFGEASGFEVRDVESLREHYVLTLRRWIGRLERAADRAQREVGAESYRIWRLYMAASAHGFASRKIGLAQTLFAKPDEFGNVRLPLTRADLVRTRGCRQSGAGRRG
jgi:cyclopropane-fatty-acyl-phospholipid synthase